MARAWARAIGAIRAPDAFAGDGKINTAMRGFVRFQTALRTAGMALQIPSVTAALAFNPVG